jgi:single-stranded-DNA-specific exonuclease
MAAGFTLRRADLDEFKAAMTAIAQRELGAYGDDLRPSLWIDAELPLSQVDWGVQRQMARLEPTGQGNPSPTFLFPGCRIRTQRAVGKGQHLKLVLSTGRGGPVVDAIAFGLGDWSAVLKPGSVVDLVGQIDVNEWNGEKRLQLVVEDMRLAGA